MNIPEEKNKSTQFNKYSGGRALNAVWSNNDLSSTEKIILIYFGSQLDFNQDFVGQWRYLPIQETAQATSLSKKTIITTLKNLVLDGFLYKEVTPKRIQIKENLSNYYALTSKIFEAYQKIVNERNQLRELAQPENLPYSPESLRLPPRSVNVGNQPPFSTSHQLPPPKKTFLEQRSELKREIQVLASNLKSVLKGEFVSTEAVSCMILEIFSELDLNLSYIRDYTKDITNTKYSGLIFKHTQRGLKEIDYFGIKKDLINWILHKEEIILSHESIQKQLQADIEIIKIPEKPTHNLSKEESKNMFKALRLQQKEAMK